jgi:two-component system LytT family response regulator
MKIRAVIIDDEEDVRYTLRYLIREHVGGQVNIVGEADDVEPGLALIRREKPDLVFLDVKMKKGTGFDMLDKISAPEFQLIFITAFNQYAIRAFKFSAVDYLLKPIDTKELVNAVQRVAQRMQEKSYINVQGLLDNMSERGDKKLVLSGSKGHHIVMLKDIVRCEADNYYTRFHLSNGKKELISKTLKEYDELLSKDGFYRVHQSHLVNGSHVRELTRGKTPELKMSDGSMVPVAQRRKDLIKQIIFEIGNRAK